MRRPLALVLAGFSIAAAFAAAPEPADYDLDYVLIVSRHGVRSPITPNAEVAKYAAQPWPEWEVPRSHLTPHGREQMALMGAYYRDYYVAQGLIGGHPAIDAGHIFFRADADQRTIASAEGLAAGLAPGAPAKIHALPEGRPDDPLFHAVRAKVGQPDRDLAVAAVRGRVGGDLAVAVEANRPAFEMLEEVLLGPGGHPAAGKVSVLDLPPAVEPGSDYDLLQLQGPLREGLRLVDTFTLEYADHKPLPEVGWGRLTPARLTQLMSLHSLGFDLAHRTFYIAQVEGSNLAGHILATLRQAAERKPIPGALGSPGDHMAVLVGHDTNLINLSGLLGLQWQLPGTGADTALPGGALVFELHRSQNNDRLSVRVRYVSQTLDQMREGTPLTLEHPPAIAPIFVPGCSGSLPNFDAPFDLFAARLGQVIDPAFTAPEPVL